MKLFLLSCFPLSKEFMCIVFWKNSSWEGLRSVPGAVGGKGAEVCVCVSGNHLSAH